MSDLFDIQTERDVRVCKFLEDISIHPSWFTLENIFNEQGLYQVLASVFKQADNLKHIQKKVYPKSTDIFRTFKDCALYQARVVFVGQDPYHQPGVADGLAFSCSKTGREQPSLKFILDEIQRTVYQEKEYIRELDLGHWAKQGVILLNTALTVEQNKPDSHTHIWYPWIEKFLREFNKVKSDSIFIFVGRKAQQFSHLIDGKKHHKTNVIHPAAAAHRGGVWDCEDVFNRINNILLQQGKSRIRW